MSTPSTHSGDSCEDAFAPASRALRSQQNATPLLLMMIMLSGRQFAPSDAEVRPDSGQDGWEAVVFLCALGIMISYADRSNISIAIIGMAKDFQWDKAFEGTVLSAFFGGYAATQLLGGRLADVLGTKWVLAAGLSTWSLATALTPLAAAAGAGPLLAVRLALGLGEGVAFPAVHAAIARLVPRSQQSFAVGLVTAASYGGAGLAFLLVPGIIENYGWQTSFFGFGALALLWLPPWLAVDVASPSAPRSPSAEAFSPAKIAEGFTGTVKELLPLMRTKEVLAICVAQYTNGFGLYGLLSWLPTFFAEQYGTALADLPVLTTLPYLLQALVGMAVGGFADRSLAQGMPVATVRKGLQTVGMLVPAAALLLAASPATGGSAAVGGALIDVGLAANALTLGAVSVNHLDVAPRHAGAIFGLGNTFATFAGLVATPLTGAVLDKTGSWEIVFTIITFHYVVGAAVFALFSGDRALEEDGQS
ncbi:PHT4 [Symbiodinium sp. CCMP2592]|nr:PHT4 [Symbiodinium sp. CCMP2592]